MKVLFKISAALLGLAVIITVISAIVDVIMKSGVLYFTPSDDDMLF